MDYKVALENMKFIEGLDFSMTTDGFVALPKTRINKTYIDHPEVPAVLDETGGLIVTPAIAAWVETIETEETYYAPLPTKTFLRVRDGEASRQRCTQALAIVYSFNKELTKDQIQAMIAEFTPAMQMLKMHWPTEAIPLIEAIVPDGIIVKQEMKDMVLEVLNNPVK